MPAEEYDLYRDSMDDLLNILKINLLIISGVLATIALFYRTEIVSGPDSEFFDSYFYFGIFTWIISVSFVGVIIARTRPTNFTSESEIGIEFLKRGGAITSAKKLHNYVTTSITLTIISVLLFVLSILNGLVGEVYGISNTLPLIVIVVVMWLYAMGVTWLFGQYTSPLLLISSIGGNVQYKIEKKLTIGPESVNGYISELTEKDGRILKEIYESDADILDVAQIEPLSEYSRDRADLVLWRLEEMDYLYETDGGKYGVTNEGAKIGKGRWFLRSRLATALRRTPQRVWAPFRAIISATPLATTDPSSSEQ